MQFLDVGEIRSWSGGRDWLDLDRKDQYVGFSVGRFRISSASEKTPWWFIESAIDALQFWEEALLLIGEANPVTPHLHLFYALRRSYGETKLVRETPGHLFLRFERQDLLTFVNMVYMNEWSARVVTSQDYGRLAMSASGTILIALRDAPELEHVRATLSGAGAEWISPARQA